MQAPIHRLKKADLVWLATHTCNAHHHSFLSHYNCYLREIKTVPERIGFFDIETTDLVADFGIMLSYAIKPMGEDKIYESVITKVELDASPQGHEDKRLVAKCLDDLKNFDKIVTYYGKRFDAPFLRSRAVMNDLPFPFYGAVKHTDLYDVIKHRFRFRSNRLEKACRNLLGHTDKTHLEPKVWRAAGRGDKAALAYITDHNRKDVTDLEKLYIKVIDFTRKQDTSI